MPQILKKCRVFTYRPKPFWPCFRRQTVGISEDFTFASFCLELALNPSFRPLKCSYSEELYFFQSLSWAGSRPSCVLGPSDASIWEDFASAFSVHKPSLHPPLTPSICDYLWGCYVFFTFCSRAPALDPQNIGIWDEYNFVTFCSRVVSKSRFSTSKLQLSGRNVIFHFLFPSRL